MNMRYSDDDSALADSGTCAGCGQQGAPVDGSHAGWHKGCWGDELRAQFDANDKRLDTEGDPAIARSLMTRNTLIAEQIKTLGA
jgi:hypothetical protein